MRSAVCLTLLASIWLPVHTAPLAGNHERDALPQPQVGVHHPAIGWKKRDPAPEPHVMSTHSPLTSTKRAADPEPQVGRHRPEISWKKRDDASGYKTGGMGGLRGKFGIGKRDAAPEPVMGGLRGKIGVDKRNAAPEPQLARHRPEVGWKKRDAAPEAQVGSEGSLKSKRDPVAQGKGSTRTPHNKRETKPEPEAAFHPLPPASHVW